MRTGSPNGLVFSSNKTSIHQSINHHHQNKTRASLTPGRTNTLLQNEELPLRSWRQDRGTWLLEEKRAKPHTLQDVDTKGPGGVEGWHRGTQVTKAKRQVWQEGADDQPCGGWRAPGKEGDGVIRPRSHVLGAKLCPPPKFTCWGPNPHTSECDCTWTQGL